jgi:tetratricopeptide (TPR) repeat protein
MSLLLDALKRAEQAKQSTQSLQESPSKVDSLQASAALSAESPRPGDSLTLEAIAEPPRRGPSATSETTDRDAVRNVFAAKQPVARPKESKPIWLLPVIGVVVLAVGGGGWFVWNEVNKLSSGGRLATAPVPKPVISATPAQPPTQPPVQVPPETKAEIPALESLPGTLAKIPLPESVAGSRSALSPADRAREDLAKSLRSADKTSESPVALKLARGIDPPRVSEALAEAYTVLRGGNFAEARRLYTALVNSDGMNLDARLGLATALARGGESANAQREYRKALEIDPRNSTALSALLVLTDAKNAPMLETDLRGLLNRHPESAELHYALGNLLAGQSRWTEAQQAYFDAWRHGSDNADYAFNLAVSLDHLRQNKLAAEYYQKALTLAARLGGQFDRRQAERRVNELKSARPQQ